MSLALIPAYSSEIPKVSTPLVPTPSMSPKAQLLAEAVTLIFAFAGTLTATGVKPAAHEPPKIAFAILCPVIRSVTWNSGDPPNGFQPT